MNQHGKFRLSVAYAALALAFTSASIFAQSATSKAEPQKVSVAFSGGQATVFAPILVAMGTKAFEKRGILIEVQNFGGAVPAFAAFAGGSADMAIVGPTQIMTAGGTGRDVIGFFNLFHGGAVVFMGAKKYEAARGQDLKKYDGSNWAYTAEGSVSQIFMGRAAQSVGLTWEKQGRLAVGGVAAFVPSLQTGRADLIAMDMKSGALSVKLGIGYPVLNTLDPAAVEHIWGRQLGLPLSTTRAFAAKYPKVVQDMADAMREGLLAVQNNIDNPAEILKMMPADFQEANRADFAEQWELVKPAFMQTDGTFSEKALTDTVAFAKATRVLDKIDMAKFDANKLFDNTWAKQAIANVPNPKR